MPRSIQEIVCDLENTKFTSSSDRLLKLCQELSSDGRFEEFADSVAIWLSKFPSSDNFIRARMPALILNNYLVNQDILNFSEFMTWETTFSNWADEIKKYSDNSKKLPFVIESIVHSMHSYKNTEQLD